jgi:hypothetical protein
MYPLLQKLARPWLRCVPGLLLRGQGLGEFTLVCIASLYTRRTGIVPVTSANVKHRLLRLFEAVRVRYLSLRRRHSVQDTGIRFRLFTCRDEFPSL